MVLLRRLVTTVSNSVFDSHLGTIIWDPSLPSSEGWFLCIYLCEVHAKKPSISLKNVHIQLSTTYKVSLANLNHHAVFCNAFPGGVEEFSGQGVEDEVDAAAVGFAKKVWEEGRVAGIEDVSAGDLEVGGKVLDLFFITNRGKYL